jgi:hypothetical protein
MMCFRHPILGWAQRRHQKSHHIAQASGCGYCKCPGTIAGGRTRSCKEKILGRGVTKGLDWPQTIDSDKIKNKAVRSESDNKLNSLKQFRRKHGLCFKCGGKWSTTHTCLDKVPLHVIEELLDALEVQSSEDSEELQSEI